MMRTDFVLFMMVVFVTGLLGSAGVASAAPFRLTTTGTINTEGLGNPPNGPMLDRFGLTDGDRITFRFDFDDQDISAGPADSLYVGLRARAEIKGSQFDAMPQTDPFRLSVQARSGSSLALDVSGFGLFVGELAGEWVQFSPVTAVNRYVELLTREGAVSNPGEIPFGLTFDDLAAADSGVFGMTPSPHITHDVPAPFFNLALDGLTIRPIPEPNAALLIGLGLACLACGKGKDGADFEADSQALHRRRL